MKKSFSVFLIAGVLFCMLGFGSFMLQDSSVYYADAEMTYLWTETPTTIPLSTVPQTFSPINTDPIVTQPIMTDPLQPTTIPFPSTMAQPTTLPQPGWETLEWKLSEDGTLTISGTGAVNNRYWSWDQTAIKKVIIEDGITSINMNAFSNCNNLIDIQLADSVERIENSPYMSYLTIPWFQNQPDGIVYLNDIALKWKGDIPTQSEIRIKDGTKTIGSNFFRPDGVAGPLLIGDSRNVSVVLPNSVTTIEEEAFTNCSWLKQITIPKSVTAIGENAFKSCYDLYILCEKDSAAQRYAEKEKIAYGLIDGTEKDNTISGSAGKIKWTLNRLTRVLKVDCVGVMPDFSGVDTPWNNIKTYIKSVVLPEGLTTIGSYAFQDCTNLTNINIPETVTKIGAFAFNRCYSLLEIDLYENVTNINYSAFSGCSLLENFTLRNPTCEILSSNFAYTTIFHGYPGSTLQTYADQYGFMFKEIEQKTPIIGDLDNDNLVTAADARLALRAAVGLNSFKDSQKNAADVNHDGEITAADARLILRAAVGLETLAA